jgi:dihydrofolate reductase
MRKLMLKMSISIDGFVGGPNGEVDWIFRSTDDAVAAWEVERLWEAGLHIMGSRTFQDMRAWWPYSDEPYAPPMNAIPKAYFSRGHSSDTSTTRALEDAKRLVPRSVASHVGSDVESWERASKLTGDLATEIDRIKAQNGKPILAHGGAAFARSLIATGLVDEYWFLVHPIALGRGLAIFTDLPAPLDLKLVASTRFPSGAVANAYQPADLHVAKEP